jgi:transposase-like protein
MQQTSEYVPCPNCGSTNIKKVNYTWWGGALGPSMFKHVKCQNCKTEYNGKTGQSNKQNIIIYTLAAFVISFCLCGGVAFLTFFLNSQ